MTKGSATLVGVPKRVPHEGATCFAENCLVLESNTDALRKDERIQQRPESWNMIVPQPQSLEKNGNHPN